MFESASNKSECQENFLLVKAAGAYGWQTYHFHVTIVSKSKGVGVSVLGTAPIGDLTVTLRQLDSPPQ
jgi:hypothetical protein